MYLLPLYMSLPSTAPPLLLCLRPELVLLSNKSITISVHMEEKKTLHIVMHSWRIKFYEFVEFLT